MKKKFLYIILLFLSTKMQVFSADLVALHHNGVATFFTSLTEAVDSAQTGDTIYIPGHTYNIGSMIIDTRLHIFGVGHFPDSTAATDRSYLSGSIHFVAGSDYSTLTGVYLTGNIHFGTNGTNHDVFNVTVERCRMNRLYLAEGQSSTSNSAYNVFRENAITDWVYGCHTQNNAFYNNIFAGAVFDFDGFTPFRNNIFVFGNCYPLNHIINCSFENNIFISSCAQYGLDLCDFKNNIFTYSWSPGTGNSGSGNITGQSPSSVFVNQSGTSFSYSHDYHLKPTSPGKNAGIDGQDIGIYGGFYPFKEGSVPHHPHIQSKTISNTTDSNGDLNVDIKVRAQDY